MSRDFQTPGRSLVLATEGMAATSHPIAARVAIETLKAGGNAADAAIAAVAILGVVEPHMTGVGGDCFCLIAKPNEKPWGYNGSGRAGSAADLQKLRAQGLTAIAPDSIHSITVPGAVEAWAAILTKHGRFGLDRALQPAIAQAENGMAVSPRVAHDWPLHVGKLSPYAGSRRHLLPGGKAPALGDVIKFPALAKSLTAIAAHGPKALYEGAIARDIAQTVTALGGSLSEADLASHRGEEVAPVATHYRGLDVTELPPNGQGAAALLILNILSHFDLAKLDPLSPERIHLMMEAGRLAYAVRDAHFADPKFMTTDLSDILNPKVARELASMIDPAKRVTIPRDPLPRGDTVLVTVVDRDRMAVSLINSLFFPFGSGVMTEETGILLHDRGAGFSLEAGHPNALAPGKRPLHTIIPALAYRGGRCDMAFGVMGGGYQALGHAHFISNMLDHGMDMQSAIDAPRAFFEDGKITVECNLPQAAIDGLRARGHEIGMRALPHGGAQAIHIDWERGVLTGASDARKDGCALGY